MTLFETRSDNAVSASRRHLGFSEVLLSGCSYIDLSRFDSMKTEYNYPGRRMTEPDTIIRWLLIVSLLPVAGYSGEPRPAQGVEIGTKDINATTITHPMAKSERPIRQGGGTEMILYKDPSTGEITSPPAAVLEELEVQRSQDLGESIDARSQAVEEVRSSAPNGGVMVVTPSWLKRPLSVTRGTDGKPAVRHSTAYEGLGPVTEAQ